MVRGEGGNRATGRVECKCVSAPATVLRGSVRSVRPGNSAVKGDAETIAGELVHVRLACSADLHRKVNVPGPPCRETPNQGPIEGQWGSDPPPHSNPVGGGVGGTSPPSAKIQAETPPISQKHHLGHFWQKKKMPQLAKNFDTKRRNKIFDLLGVPVTPLPHGLPRPLGKGSRPPQTCTPPRCCSLQWTTTVKDWEVLVRQREGKKDAIRAF